MAKGSASYLGPVRANKKPWHAALQRELNACAEEIVCDCHKHAESLWLNNYCSSICYHGSDTKTQEITSRKGMNVEIPVAILTT